MLKRFYLLIFLIALFVNPLAVYSENFPSNTVLSYFETLKMGDIETLKNYTSENFYRKNIVLLEQNKNYPEFLKKFYKGSIVEIIDIEYINERDAVVTVKVIFINKSVGVHKFLLSEYDGEWKIREELYD